MDVCASLVAKREAPKAVQPGQRPLDDPAEHAEATAVWTAGLGDHGHNALSGEPSVSRRRPVGAIALDDTWFAARATAPTGDGRQRRDHRFELRHIVDVGGGELGDQRNAAGIRDDVMFRALLTAIGWVRSSFFPPRTARTEPLSITVHR